MLINAKTKGVSYSWNNKNIMNTEAELLLLKLIHLFAREVLLIKKLEIEETKTIEYSTFKTDIIKGGLVFSISNFFINKKKI